MKRNTLFALLMLMLAGGLGAGCASHFYEDSRNWVLRNNEIPAYSSEFDVFYLYPTQVQHTSGETMNWEQAGIALETRRYVTTMMSSLSAKHTRVFCPFVPQLGYDAYCKLMEEKLKAGDDLDLRKSPLGPAIHHAVLALKHYLKHYNPDGRPFVLLGQEQGAVILYEAMKEVSAVFPENGFIVAYLHGMPPVTPEKLREDFGGRGIGPATGRYDAGVMVFYNTRLPGEKDECTPPGGCVINPLNWHVDATPAKPQENNKSIFYIYGAKKSRRISNFCGAVADPERGVVLLTDVSPKVKLKLSEFVFQSDIWGVFEGAIGRNAAERVREYTFRHRLKSAR